MQHNDPRQNLILDWLRNTLQLDVQSLEPASADASFRRYFRAELIENGALTTRIVMDAPPAHEDIRPFLRIDQHLAACGVHVPHIHAYSIEHGLMLLEDLGNTPYLAALQQAAPHSVDLLYGDALRALLHLQTCPSTDLPAYDHAKLTSEMQLFETWYLQRHLGLNLNDDDLALLNLSLIHISEPTRPY